MQPLHKRSDFFAGRIGAKTPKQSDQPTHEN